MTSGTTQRPPDEGGGRRSRALLIGLVTAALLSAVLAFAISSRHQLASSAQSATPTPSSASWAMPTLPPLHYPSLVWLDPTGQPLSTLPSGTITTSCTRNNFTVHVSPEAPSYPRGVPVVFKMSIIFTGPHPCFISGVTIPTVTVFDSSHNVVWGQEGRYGGKLAYIPAGQLTAAGDVLVREVGWVHDVCIFGNCPETEAPSGTYTAQAFFLPYGQSEPATVQIES